MGMEMEMTGTQDMRPSPTLVAFTQILQLSGQELGQAISLEVQSNPALEVEERDICPVCGEVAVMCQCAWPLQPEPTANANDDEEFDLLTIVAGQVTLEETLLREVGILVPTADQFIAEYLIGCLDDRGFLDVALEDVARSLGVDVGRVTRVLTLIQSVGPLGVGARDVQECLDLQLRRWEEQDIAHPLARAIIEQHLAALGEGRYGQIARKLGVGMEDVIEARDFIRAHLRPYPVPDLSPLETWTQPTETPYVAPDVIMRARPGAPGEFEVEVVESRRYAMRIAPFYQSLAQPATAPGATINPKDREQVQGYVSRARSFLSHVRERRETMRRVAQYVADRQIEFLRHGTRHLIPLTRAEVAEAIHLHESTVSRATANKYVMLPWRQVVPFSHFFQASLSVRDVLKEIIQQSQGKPLTDAQLVDRLAEKGYHVARRTVAKYRDQLGILPSSLR
jgi:RNA polymerase sigma-54 factor